MPLDEPCMSDRTLLVSVEDLISIAFGPNEKNVVNFKVIQTILHILARQQRMLQQRVEIRITEVRQETPPATHKKLKKVTESEESSPSSSPRTPTAKKRRAGIKPERHDKIDKEKAKAEKEKARLEKEKGKERERELKAQEKADRSRKREREKLEKEEQKELQKMQREKDKAERSASKEREKAERSASKEREKAERAAEKAKEKAERSESKEREKAERAAEKEKEKAERSASKEREKAEKAAEKEKEKAERSASKEREKAEKEKEKEERSASKEREKAEKAAEKEKEKAERAAEKEKRAAEIDKEKADKAERKERERAEKEAAKAQKEKDHRDKSPPPTPASKDKKKKKQLEPVSSVNISEVERGKEKVLVVEKGPTTRSELRSRGGSIDVVTQSQFALLEAAVRGLEQRAAPMGELRMPDNEQLKSDLAKGTASLTDTMQAMQVNARVTAAEEAINRMAGLLTKLAAAGAVPEALANQVAEAKREAEQALTSDTDDGAPIRARPSTARKSVAIDPMVKTSTLARPSTAGAGSVQTPRGSVSTIMGRASILSRPSSTFTTASDPKVTKSEMEDVIKAVRDDLWKGMNSMTTKATAAAEGAMNTARNVADKLDVALQLDRRISSLHGLVADYAEQLNGFDAGLTTQMQSFQEQIMQIRSDLTGGLNLLENVNNNAETAAVMELTERYEELVGELERTVSAHNLLSAFQGKLGDELRSLVECVEMLREQKADREEVIDGLRDKADSSRLAGLLTEADFALARAELNHRLQVCHDKFKRQDGIWMVAIKDLLKTTDLKAEIIDLLSMREDTQRQLRELHERARLLAAVLGEPKAALLTRQLARDALCGACGAAALMRMRDPSTGVPPALPALRAPVPAPADEPCLAALGDQLPAEEDRHMCLRWVGGSHTLLSERVTREEAPPTILQGIPTRKFADYGMDGRLYMMEEELQPCLECNVLLEKYEEQERPAPVGEEGAGDQGQINQAID